MILLYLDIDLTTFYIIFFPSVVITTYIAKKKGQGLEGFIIGIVLGPLGIIFALLTKNQRQTEDYDEDEEVIKHEKHAEESNNNNSDTYSDAVLSTGTGFIISDDAYVVTNSHVIDGCTHLNVVYQGDRYPSKVVAQDLLITPGVALRPGVERLRPTEVLFAHLTLAK